MSLYLKNVYNGAHITWEEVADVRSREEAVLIMCVEIKIGINRCVRGEGKLCGKQGMRSTLVRRESGTDVRIRQVMMAQVVVVRQVCWKDRCK